MSEPEVERIERTGRGTTSRQPSGGAAEWDDVARRLREGSGTSWLSVPARRGGVHTRPVFAAWTGHTLCFTTNPGAAKTAELEANPDVSLAVDLGDIHLVVEGTATRLTTATDLERASAAMLEVYGWPTTVVDDLLDAPYAAPTSGGPPFQAWELVPRRAYAFPTEDQVEPTRFRFAP